MGRTTTQMELVSITKLVPYVNNARTHSPEQIMKLRSSLREFGFINPVIIDKDYGIIAGHGRVMAAKEEGIDEVPCVFVDYLTEAQKKAYILADNRMALDAGWDEEMLKIEIESLQGMDFDISLAGFDDDEIADLFAGDDKSDVKEDDFDLNDALEKAAFVERGDVWTVGRHRLMCGDATNPDDVATLMDGKKANLVLTDPPYAIDRESYNCGQNFARNMGISDEGVNSTLKATGPDAVAVPTYSSSKASLFTSAEEELANTLVATDYKDPPLVNDTDADLEYIVRRLTPTECARLQGLPDWWCAGLGEKLPSEEELTRWAEIFETHRKIVGTSSKPKTRKQIFKWLQNPHSDSAEYKMWGNGVALPNVVYVLTGIVYYTQNDGV